MSQRRIWIGLRLRTFTGWHLSSVKTLLSIYVLSAVTELRCHPVVSCFAKWYVQIVSWILFEFEFLSRFAFIPIILFVGLVSSMTGFRLWTDFRMWPDFASDRTSFWERVSSALWPDFHLRLDFASDPGSFPLNLFRDISSWKMDPGPLWTGSMIIPPGMRCIWAMALGWISAKAKH